jgi:uncharacterized protein
MENIPIIKSSIIGVCILATALILGNAVKNRNNHQDSITVTGLGSKDFTSDEILFSGSFSANAIDAQTAYNTIQADQAKVKAFFKSKNFTDTEIQFTGIELSKKFKEITTREDDRFVKSEQIFDGYTASQNIKISAKKNTTLMTKIEAVSDQTSELINSGIQLNISPLQYTYSDLPSLKHSLIENATKDANERAEKIVKNADGNLGKLKNASMGVFQITGKGNIEEDSYGGNNDTYSKEKTARITVRLDYNLE